MGVNTPANPCVFDVQMLGSEQGKEVTSICPWYLRHELGTDIAVLAPVNAR